MRRGVKEEKADVVVESNICLVCERDLNVKPHTEWEASDCLAEMVALKAAGLSPTASFLNPRHKDRVMRGV